MFISENGPRTILTNTNLKILTRIRRQFGLGSVDQKRKAGNGLKACYQWVCWNRQAEEFLNAILPLLVIKKKEARIALRYIALMGRGSGSSGRTPMKPALLAKRRKLIAQCKAAKCV